MEETTEPRAGRCTGLFLCECSGRPGPAIIVLEIQSEPTNREQALPVFLVERRAVMPLTRKTLLIGGALVALVAIVVLVLVYSGGGGGGY